MKKLMRKLLAVAAAMTMVMAMGVTAFAASSDTYTGTGAQTDSYIEVDNAAKGQTYELYKLFDATYNSTTGAIAYTLPAGKATEGLSPYFQIVSGTTNNVEVANGTNAATLRTTAFQTWATNFGTKIGETLTPDDQNGNSVKWENIPYGYYYVKSSLGAVLSVNSTKPHQTVQDKNTQNPAQDTEKQITKTTDNLSREETTVNASTGTAKVGDKISYQVTFTATNYTTTNNSDGTTSTTKMMQYVLSDTNSGLNIDPATISITVQKQNRDDTLGPDQYANSTVKAQEATKDEKGNVTLTIPWVDSDGNSLYEAPATVTVTYDATLTSTTGNNTVVINNNGKESNTTVDTAQVRITKIANDDAKTKLTGATFKLYDAQTGGHQISVTLDPDGNYVVDPNGSASTLIEVTREGETGDAASQATIKGLKENTVYYLEEITAPAGYTLPSSRIALKATNATTALQDQDVTNTKGTELPSTGGIGTTIFYVLGAALVIGAGVVLVTRRRLSR